MNKFDFVLEEIKILTKNATDKTEYDHSQLVWQWVLKLKPDADIALQISALGHDIDRSFEDRKKRQDFATYDEYKKEHALLSAQIMCNILQKYDFDKTTIDKVKHLIENHEVGGEGDVEILKGADSIAFFNNLSHYRQLHTQEQTIDKIKFMYERLNEKAKLMINSINFKSMELEELFEEAINKIILKNMKVILYMAISANGMIAKIDDNTSWISETEWNSYSSMVCNAGCLIVGQRTYHTLTKQPEFSEFKNVKLVVVSNNDFPVLSPNHQIATSPKKALELLQDFDTVIVAGGGILNASFLKENLVNEVYLDIEPIILGNGIKLFNGDDFETKLELLETKQLSSNELQLHYKIVK